MGAGPGGATSVPAPVSSAVRAGPAPGPSALRLLVLAALVAVGSTLMTPAPATASPSRAVGTVWSWPLAPEPEVVRAFAPGPGPYSPGHLGADLAGAAGAPVLAAAAGRVSYAGLVAGRGVVVVDTGGLRSTYEPVRAQVTVGAQVEGGDVLGALDPGHPCGRPACLHWGLRRGAGYLDPLLLLRGPVRLLPVGPQPPAPAVAAPARVVGRTPASTVSRPQAVGRATGPGGGARLTAAAVGLAAALVLLVRRGP